MRYIGKASKSNYLDSQILYLFLSSVSIDTDRFGVQKLLCLCKALSCFFRSFEIGDSV